MEVLGLWGGSPPLGTLGTLGVEERVPAAGSGYLGCQGSGEGPSLPLEGGPLGFWGFGEGPCHWKGVPGE